MRVSARRAAAVAITIQFLALVRTLGEIYRLRAVRGPSFLLADALPFVTGGVIAALGAWAAVSCYMLERYRLAVGAVALTVLGMLAYKLAVVG
jgi:hypothetical protein